MAGRKIFFSVIMAVAGIVLFATGCAFAGESAKTVESVAAFDTADQRQGFDVASAYVKAASEALRTDDFESWRRVSSGKFADRITPEAFKWYIRDLKKLGTFSKIEYLGFLDWGSKRSFLWKMQYVKPADKDRPERRFDVVFQVQLILADGKPQVAGFALRFL